MTQAAEASVTTPPPSTPKAPAKLINYLVFVQSEDGKSWTPIGEFKARTAQKAIEAGLESYGGEKGTFAATPESKFTVKSPKLSTQIKIVWE